LVDNFLAFLWFNGYQTFAKGGGQMSDLPEASKAAWAARSKVDAALAELASSLKLLVSAQTMGSLDIPLENQPEEIATLYETVRARMEDTIQEVFRPHVQNVELRCGLREIGVNWSSRKFRRSTSTPRT